MKTYNIKIAAMALAFSLSGLGINAQGHNDNEILGQSQIDQSEKHYKAKKSPEDRAAHRTARLTKDLKLDQKQQQEILALNLASAKKHEMRKRAERKDREASRIEKEKQYKSILTEAQFKTYQDRQLKKSAVWKDADGKIIPRKKRMKGKKNRAETTKSCCKKGAAKKCCAEDCTKDCCAPKK